LGFFDNQSASFHQSVTGKCEVTDKGIIEDLPCLSLHFFITIGIIEIVSKILDSIIQILCLFFDILQSVFHLLSEVLGVIPLALSCRFDLFGHEN
jgi:hypothetical protein